MLPRFIMKTHTNSLKPGNYSILVTKCTSPHDVQYQENVEKKLLEFLGNKLVSRFTVLTSTKKNRGFGFLHENMIWSWKGYVLNSLMVSLGKVKTDDISSFFTLSKKEQIAYLKYYLETEGAIIFKFAGRFAGKKKINYSFLKTEIKKIFEEIYEEYLDIAPDFQSRLKIREMYNSSKLHMKRKEYNYDPSTLAHKIKPHIKALSDLRLLHIHKEDNEEAYYPIINNNISPFDIFVEEIKSIQDLEDHFSRDEYFYLIAKILNLKTVRFSIERHENCLKHIIIQGYKIMSDKVTGMADIYAIIDWVCINLLAENNIIIKNDDVMNFFDKIRKVDSSSIQYHVDGRGNIAYIILNPKSFNNHEN